ncbi:hypothetical protein NYP83_02300 [Erwinia pyrifoliae]|uniref:hypothetical protein n=1 Tax=Erwinia pyrifoliae TaxID=79967 RepID=UPI0021D7B90E|nr:hypothetical protein [Erwinia pyrifoliae]MCU8585773.1 hypothetical protein [Erwinia pyrifoliae]
MGKLIFRRVGGVVRPMTVDEVIESDSHHLYENRTPKYDLENKRYDTISSFTVPNVKCNECGQDVFYYENPNGARVLFDSLGPPWPVHPCYMAAQHKLLPPNTPKKEAGWHPVIIQKSVVLSGGGIRIQASYGEKKIRFEFDSTTFSRFKCSPDAVCMMLCFINPQKKSSVQIHNGKKIYKTRFNEFKDQQRISIDSSEKDNYVVPFIQYDVVIDRNDNITSLYFEFNNRKYKYNLDNKIMDVHFFTQDKVCIYCENNGDNLSLYFFGKKSGCRLDLDSSSDQLLRADDYEDYFSVRKLIASDDGHLILKGVFNGEKISVVAQDVKFDLNQVFINNIRNRNVSLFLKKKFVTDNGTNSRLLLAKDKNGILWYEGSVVYRKNLLSVSQSQKKIQYNYKISSLMKLTDFEVLKESSNKSLIKTKVMTLKLLSDEELLVSLMLENIEMPLLIKSHKFAIRQLDVDLRAIGANIRVSLNENGGGEVFVNKKKIGKFLISAQQAVVQSAKRKGMSAMNDIQNEISKTAKEIDISSNVLANAFLVALKK